MSLLQFIKESLLFESKNRMNYAEIKDLIINSQYRDIFRDEMDGKFTPEKNGKKSVLVIKKSQPNELCLNYATSKLSRRELDTLIINLGGKEINRNVKDVFFSMSNGKEMKCHYSGQFYDEREGVGHKGTTDKNLGTLFEIYLTDNVDKLKELCLGIAKKAGIKKYINEIPNVSQPTHVGGKNTHLGAIGENFFKTFRYSSLTNYSKKVADILLGDASISLKKDEGVITLWNGSVEYGSNAVTNKDKAKEFMNLFIEDEEVREMIDTLLTLYYPKDSVITSDKWQEIKKENQKLKRDKIYLKPKQVNMDNIIKLLQFAWKLDVFIVTGVAGGNSICGFYMDDKSMDKLTDIDEIILILPYTTKMIGLQMKTKNGVVYRLDLRDRSAGNVLNVPELVMPNGLHPDMMKKIGLSGFTEINIQ